MFLRKGNLKFWVGSQFEVLGVGEWYGVWVIRGVGGGVGISEKFLKIFAKIYSKFPVKCSMIRKREIHIVRRQNNILINDLWENNSTIISDSPVEYLRNDNLYVSLYLFPTPFTCVSVSLIILLRLKLWLDGIV